MINERDARHDARMNPRAVSANDWKALALVAAVFLLALLPVIVMKVLA